MTNLKASESRPAFHLSVATAIRLIVAIVAVIASVALTIYLPRVQAITAIPVPDSPSLVFFHRPLTTDHSLFSSLQSLESEIQRNVDQIVPSLIEVRRELHTHPELSNREEQTGKFIVEKLRALKLDVVQANVARNGVVAILKGAKPGPVVAIRADMDALPIEETIDVPYKSKNKGVKHACGHDVHMTVALGVAEVLSKMRADLPGTVKFLFQPAEEGPPPDEEGGAALMIKEGALDNPRPSAIFGLHVMPNIEVGEVGFNSGPAMASSDRFTVTIRGKKVHGAYPHDGIDAVVVAAECVTALQTIRSRRIDTQQPLVITIGSIHGGNRFNIITDEVTLEGTMRTLDESVRTRAQEMMRETLAGITTAYGASYKIEWGRGNPVTYNDPALVKESLPAIQRVIGNGHVMEPKPQMGAEDFSLYQKVIPGFFFFLGVGNKSRGITAMIHTPEFDVDERAIGIGARVMSTVVVDYLTRHSSNP